ncbi:MAG: hypothetical protein JSR59_14735 [Proteobacteria bacterium]|nr:hypothetical protein [Pseudomonadota bacterium]
MHRYALVPLAAAVLLLAGCDMLGIETPEKVAAARDGEGRAIGAGCRQAARAIEDCYALNKKADKAAVFAGWRDMNDYMRENKLDPVTPVVANQMAAQASAPKGNDAGDDDAKHAEKAADTGAKPGRKARES